MNLEKTVVCLVEFFFHLSSVTLGWTWRLKIQTRKSKLVNICHCKTWIILTKNISQSFKLGFHLNFSQSGWLVNGMEGGIHLFRGWDWYIFSHNTTITTSQIICSCSLDYSREKFTEKCFVKWKKSGNFLKLYGNQIYLGGTYLLLTPIDNGYNLFLEKNIWQKLR